MSDQNLFRDFVHARNNRRQFFKQAGALGVSAAAFSAFLEACGGTPSPAPTTAGSTSTNTNMAGPIDMQTLIANAKKEGKLEAIGIPPEWADYQDILDNYTSKYVTIQYKAERSSHLLRNSKSSPSRS